MSFRTMPNEAPITRLYAVVSEDADGRHGIVADLREGRWFPLVSSKSALLHEMELVAKRLGEQHNMKTLIMTFTLANKVLVHEPFEETGRQTTA